MTGMRSPAKLSVVAAILIVGILSGLLSGCTDRRPAPTVLPAPSVSIQQPATERNVEQTAITAIISKSPQVVQPSTITRFSRVTTFGLNASITTSAWTYDALVIAGTATGSIVAADTDTRVVMWSVDLGAPVSSLAIGDLGVVAAAEKRVVLLDPASGAVRWEILSPSRVSAQLRVTTRAIYAGLADGSIVSLGPTNGEQIWRSDAGSGGAVVGDIAILDGVVYAAQEGGFVTANSAQDGRESWRVSLPGRVAVGPLMYKNIVIGSGINGTLTGLGRVDGSLQFQIPGRGEVPGARPQTILSAPVIQGDTIIQVSADGMLVARDLAAALRGDTPSTLWEASLGGHQAGRAVSAGSSIVAVNAEGILSVNDVRDGSLISTFTMPSAPLAAPTALPGTLIIALSDGTVAILDAAPDSGSPPLFAEGGQWTLPPEGVFRLTGRTVVLQIPAREDAVVEWRVSSRPDEELVVTVLTSQGSVLATNMGKVALSDSVRVSIEAGSVYLMRIERTTPAGEVELSVIERIVE